MKRLIHSSSLLPRCPCCSPAESSARSSYESRQRPPVTAHNAAVNEALRRAQELAARKLGGATGGLDLGGLGGLGLPGL